MSILYLMVAIASLASLCFLFYRNWIMTKEKLKDAKKSIKVLQKMVQSRNKLNDPDAVDSVLDELVSTMSGEPSNKIESITTGSHQDPDD